MLSFELERQLFEYGRQVDAQIITLEPDNLVQLSPKGPVRRTWLIAASVAILTLLTVGLIPFLTNSSDSPAADSVTALPFVSGLDNPNDVAFDPSGWLVISEHFRGGVSKVQILPDGTAGESIEIAIPHFNDLERLTVDDSGTVYFSDNDTVFRVTDETAPIQWPMGLFAAGFVNAEGLAIDDNGDLYVADSSESGVRISRVTVPDDGKLSTTSEVVIVPGGDMAGDIVLGPNGELVVINLDEIWEVTFTEDGSATLLRVIANIPGEPRTVAFDPSGTLHVGTSVGTVWSIEPDGESTVVATGFDNVEALAFDASGVLYLVEGNRVLKLLLE